MLSRVAGLPVLVEHPAGGRLTSSEFSDRNVGSILLPYIADADGFQNDTDPANFGPDVWAVARIYDDATNNLLQERTISTSPSVNFSPSDGNVTIPLGDGSHVLLEKSPQHLCHVSLVENGVWDRENGPSGIRNDLLKGSDMSDEIEKTPEEKEAEAPNDAAADMEAKIDQILAHMGTIGARMDAMEAADKARRDTRRKDADGLDLNDDGSLPGRGETRRTAADTAKDERADAAAKALVQARADAAYLGLGSRAPSPMMGETLQGYRSRMARGLQRHSAGFDKIDLATLSGPAFDAIEDRIYGDAVVAARTPETIPGVIREVVKVDPATGQRTINFFGDHTFIHEMKRPSRRLIGINTRPAG